MVVAVVSVPMVAPVVVVVVDAGVIVVVVATGVAVMTVRFTAGLVIPSKPAVIFVLPMASAAAVPDAETVAMVGSELDQVTCEEISTPERPSE